MATTKQPGSRSEYWRQLVREQEQGGLPVRAFCQQTKVNEHSFYNWRAKLHRQAGSAREPVRFALVEPLGPTRPTSGWAMELVLAMDNTRQPLKLRR